MYDLTVSVNDQDEVVFNRKGQEAFKVRKDQFAQVCYLMEGVYKSSIILEDLSEKTTTMDTAFLTSDAAGYAIPSRKLLFNEIVSLVTCKPSAMDKLLEGWRLTLLDVPYEELADVLTDFALIPSYSYTIPMITGDGRNVRGELEDDYLGTLIAFQNAADGKGVKPDVQDETLYEPRHLWQDQALLLKDAVGMIEDRGTYRNISFKPEYDHTGRAGNKISVDVSTPLTVVEILQKCGRDDILVIDSYTRKCSVPGPD